MLHCGSKNFIITEIGLNKGSISFLEDDNWINNVIETAATETKNRFINNYCISPKDYQRHQGNLKPYKDFSMLFTDSYDEYFLKISANLAYAEAYYVLYMFWDKVYHFEMGYRAGQEAELSREISQRTDARGVSGKTEMAGYYYKQFFSYLQNTPYFNYVV